MDTLRQKIEDEIHKKISSLFHDDLNVIEKLYELENLRFGHINRIVYKVANQKGELRALKIINLRCGREYKQQHILNNVTNEICKLEIIKNNTNIPIPTIYETIIEEDYIFILMNLIEGNRLSLVYDSLSEKSIEDLKTQLRNYNNQLRSIKTNDPNKTIIHGDLGTYNIMVSGPKIVSIIDWEVSREEYPEKELEIISSRHWDKHKEFIIDSIK